MSAKNATMAVVPCFRKDTAHPEYAQIDLSAATENLLLEAVELGLGAVWLGIAPIRERMDRVRDILGLPEHLEAFAVVPVGSIRSGRRPNRTAITRPGSTFCDLDVRTIYTRLGENRKTYDRFV